MKETHQIIVVGGGLAGLCSSIQLQKAGYQVLLLERHQYPKHKVCGEYISNEVLDYLNQLGLNPFDLGAKNITTFRFSSNKGAALQIDLPLGGFGISRYALDAALCNLALQQGVCIHHEKVTAIGFTDNQFEVTTNKASYNASFVIGAYGKRSVLDKALSRKFITNKTPWVAVKAHYQGPQPAHVVGLHHFEGGYCGLSQVETGAVNACYLVHQEVFGRFKDIPSFQENVIAKNRHLKAFYAESNMLFENPLTISQVSFESKTIVEDHVLMIGDSAGLIHPLCGNGMAMAIHSAKIVSDVLIAFKLDPNHRSTIETQFKNRWHHHFDSRMRAGKWIQKGLLHPGLTAFGVAILQRAPRLLSRLIKTTHGNRI